MSKEIISLEKLGKRMNTCKENRMIFTSFNPELKELIELQW